MDTKGRVVRVGLTGGIASGKTLVAGEFARLGIPIIDTDEISRAVVEPGQPALAEITAVFGQDVLTDSGELDRQQLRGIVFTDEKLRQQLETILHPRIRERTLKASETAGGPYQIIVVPLLFEAGFQSLVERVLVVDCPESLQRKRLIDRDNEEPKLADRVIAAQLPALPGSKLPMTLLITPEPSRKRAARSKNCISNICHSPIWRLAKRTGPGSGIICGAEPSGAK